MYLYCNITNIFASNQASCIPYAQKPLINFRYNNVLVLKFNKIQRHNKPHIHKIAHRTSVYKSKRVYRKTTTQEHCLQNICIHLLYNRY